MPEPRKVAGCYRRGPRDFFTGFPQTVSDGLKYIWQETGFVAMCQINSDIYDVGLVCDYSQYGAASASNFISLKSCSRFSLELFPRPN